MYRDVDSAPLAYYCANRTGSGRTWSHYQQAIYDFVRHGTAHGVVDAVPGRGKTTTLVEACTRVDADVAAHFLAFNWHIARELQSRLPAHAGASTIHSLGHRTLGLAGYGREVDERKYGRLCTAFLVERYPGASREELRRLTDVLLGLVIPYISPLPRPSASGVIDYTDMIWLPVVEDLQPRHTDWVMVDESQDLNRCGLELVLRAYARGGRLLFVGDRRQAMYGFAGADPRSMECIEKRTQSERLPPSMCYRCPSSHVTLAGQVYPGIEPAPGAPAGVIEEDVAEDDAVDMMQAGDLMLCRTTAPLLTLYYRLIRRRKPARLRGHDIGVRLLSVLKRVEKQAGFAMSDFLVHLQRCEAEALAELVRQDADEMVVQSLHDKYATVRVIYGAERPQSMQEMRDAVSSIFPKDVDHPVILSKT